MSRRRGLNPPTISRRTTLPRHVVWCAVQRGRGATSRGARWARTAPAPSHPHPSLQGVAPLTSAHLLPEARSPAAVGRLRAAAQHSVPAPHRCGAVRAAPCKAVCAASCARRQAPPNLSCADCARTHRCPSRHAATSTRPWRLPQLALGARHLPRHVVHLIVRVPKIHMER